MPTGIHEFGVFGCIHAIKGEEGEGKGVVPEYRDRGDVMNKLW